MLCGCLHEVSCAVMLSPGSPLFHTVPVNCDAAAVIVPYPSTYVRSPYNAYETVSAQSCSVATKGCCSSTSLTSLVLDTSVTYNCYTLSSPGVNDFAISVRVTSPVHIEA